MTKPATIWTLVILLILIGGSSYYFGMRNSSDTMMDDGNIMMDGSEGSMMSKGSYEVYSPEKISLASKGDVVLFFRATWCPTCKALDEDIKANISKIPSGLTILDVDYDKYTELKKKYGVTYQHTMVQIDSNGNLIAKWSGSPTLSDLVSKVK